MPPFRTLEHPDFHRRPAPLSSIPRIGCRATDTLFSHKSPKAVMLKDVEAWFLPLPPGSPDLRPIEMAFAKLKTLIRKAAAQTCDALWQAVGRVCHLFTEQECYNVFSAAGYEAT